MDISSFVSELRRRRVFRVAGVYAVIAWLMIQIAETVFPYLLIPDWAVRLVIVLSLLGLPIAVVLAWAYELTPDGMQRATPQRDDGAAPPPPAGGRGRALPLAIAGSVAVLLGVVLVAGYGFMRGGDAAPAEDRPISSIAVLAFEDMSPAQDQEYFGDGIAEELLDALTRIPGLEVASRTSAFSFKDKDAGIGEIASALGVQAVLEGSVRTSGDRLRITAQLIDARTDRHLWSETYDRDFTDIFVVQDDISRSIIGALRGRLARSRGSLVQSGTSDAEAYRLFLQGRHALSEGGAGAADRAIGPLEQAIERDPEYAEAYGVLADAYSAAGRQDDAAAAASRAGELAALAPPAR